MSTQPPPNDERITRKEIAKLTRPGAIALATRSAMRIAPLFQPNEDRSPEKAATEYLAIDICSLSAALFATNVDMSARLNAATYAHAAANANTTNANAASAAYAAVYARTAAYAAAQNININSIVNKDVYYEDAYAAYVSAITTNTKNITASKADYNVLLEYNLGLPGSKRKPVPQDFFARPLWPDQVWPDQEALMPPGWQRVLEDWQERLAELGLWRIYDRHMMMIHGQGLDWERAREDLDTWTRQYAPEVEAAPKTKKKTSERTLKLDPSANKKTYNIDQLSSPIPEVATPEPPEGAEADLAPPPETASTESSEALEQKTTEQPDTPTPLPFAPGRIGNPTSHADLPARQDLLGRQTLVDALAAMIASSEQGTPFTLALLGDWGVGKSSVMKLLQDKLNETERYKGRFDFAWFNAWEYEHTDNMAAGLAQEVVAGLVSHVQPWWRIVPRNWLFLRFAYHRHGWEFAKKVIALLAVVVLALLPAIGLMLGDPNSDWFKWLDRYKLPAIGTSGAIAFVFLITLGRNFVAGFKEILQHPLSAQLKTYLNMPTYKEHLGHIPVIKKDIKALCGLQLGGNKEKPRRLVVFVDDLDRCGPECISKTLDAVRLVMDLEHVVVVIGIDHHIALRAIGEQYKELADDRRSKEDIARDYLGKIIQLPIRLTPSEGQDLKQFVHQKLFLSAKRLAPRKDPATTPGSAAAIDTSVETATGDPSPASNPDQSQPGTPQTEPLETSGTDARGDTPATTLADVSSLDSNDASTTSDEPEIDLEQVMHDTHAERDLFHTLADRFGFSNPRQLTRIRNSYRLLKTLDKLQRQPTTPTGEQANRWQWLMQMVFWQEFLYQWPRPVRNACVDALKNDQPIPPSDLPTHASEVFDNVAMSIRATFSISLQHTETYEQAAGFVRTLILPRGDEARRPRPDQDQTSLDDDNTQSS